MEGGVWLGGTLIELAARLAVCRRRCCFAGHSGSPLALGSHSSGQCRHNVLDFCGRVNFVAGRGGAGRGVQ